MHLDKYLQDLEDRIDEGVEEDLLAGWKEFADNRFQGEVFVPARRKAAPPKVAWPKVLINDALENYDLMALAQFADCSRTLEKAGGQIMMVRSDYGTSILPSLFGVRLFIMERDLDTLPTSMPLNDLEAIRRLIGRGAPQLYQSLGAKSFEMGKRFAEIRERYPKIGKYVNVYHPDLQGAMDVCEVIWGSRLFTDVIEYPDLVKSFLELVCRTYISFLREWHRIVSPPADGYGFHWGLLHKGRIMLRTDSAMNFSPGMFDEFIRPYEQQLLDAFGGGAVHFCGRGDHYIESMSAMRGLSGVNMSQPELNDMEVVYRNTIDKGIKLVGFDSDWAARALASGRKLHGQVHCWSRPELKKDAQKRAG
jgi:hypothetical protein